MKKILWYLRKVLHIWWFELRCILFSGRFLVMSLITFILVHFYLKELLDLARDYKVGMYPAAVPVFFSDGTFACLGILLVIFMESVFPVTNRLQRNVLVQAGCGAWCSAQMLAVMSVVAVWLAELQLFVCILIGGRLDFSGWGKVWGSCANGTARELGYGTAVSVPKEMVMSYGPGEAVRMSIFFAFLLGALFGGFIFCVDGICRNSIGEILLSVWSLGYLVIANIRGFDGIQFLQKFSPKSWLGITRYIGRPGSFRESVVMMCSLILVLYLLNYLLVKRKRIVLE